LRGKFPDESRRLTPQQQTAIEHLLLGPTIIEAAGAAGVTRQTVSEWSNHHSPFQTELARRRAEALRDVQQRLEEAALLAVEVLAQIAADPAVAAGERIKASAAIPERCGV
jgi:hypothetical protein